jgi:DNA-binding NarL/FixJ family response regulator
MEEILFLHFSHWIDVFAVQIGYDWMTFWKDQPDPLDSMNSANQTKILFVSEPGLMQEGMHAVLSTLPHVSIVGLASGSLSALYMLSRCEVDVVVIDANIPMEEMLALVRSINALRPPVACIALASTRSQMRLAVAEGANASLPRSSSLRQISEVIQTAVRRIDQL